MVDALPRNDNVETCRHVSQTCYHSSSDTSSAGIGIARQPLIILGDIEGVHWI